MGFPSLRRLDWTPRRRSSRRSFGPTMTLAFSPRGPFASLDSFLASPPTPARPRGRERRDGSRRMPERSTKKSWRARARPRCCLGALPRRSPHGHGGWGGGRGLMACLRRRQWRPSQIRPTRDLAPRPRRLAVSRLTHCGWLASYAHCGPNL